MKNDQCIFLSCILHEYKFYYKKMLKYLSCILSSFLNFKILAYPHIRIVSHPHYYVSYSGFTAYSLSQSVIPVRRT